MYVQAYLPEHTEAQIGDSSACMASPSLRHYNAVHMMKMGIPDKVAAGRRHSQISTLREIYQHATEGRR